MTAGAFPPLEPVGVGSGMVESLTSYARRLSYWLALPVRTVVRAAVPWVPSSNVEFTEAINGTELLGRDIAAGLSALTGVESVASLSLAAHRSDLYLRWDFRGYRAWCPICLSGVQEPAADPLIWSFTASSVCVRHTCALRDRCPNRDCERQHRPWHARAQPGRCPHCGKALGGGSAPRRTDPTSAIVLDVIGWLQAGHRIGRDQVATIVRSQVERDGYAKVAREFGVNESAIRSWVGGRVRLGMGTLVTVAGTKGWTMERLASEASRLRTPLIGATRVTPRAAFLQEKVEAELAKPAITRRSPAILAAELGLGQQALLGQCPRLQILIDEGKARRRQARADRQAAVIVEALEAAGQLATAGEPIRMSRISQICGWKPSEPQPETRAAIRLALRIA